MFKNYLKIAWRSLLKNRLFSLINVLGLAVGMTFAMLIGLWVKYELSFDTFHKNRERVAIILKSVLFNNDKGTQFTEPLPLYDELKSTYSEVKRITRLDWGASHSLKVDVKRFNKRGFYVDPDFLKMFSFPLVKGNSENVLDEPYSIVLTESLAEGLFGHHDPKQGTLFLHPLTKWHLYSEFKDWINVGGKIDYVRLFAIVGLLVLLIACINFMNLSTARSEKRAKEVGIRKAIGSQRQQLIGQFLSESLLTAFLAFLLSLELLSLVLPLLKDLGFENISFDFTNISLLLIGFAACVLTGLLAGSYPAFYLSSFAPVKVLKGAMNVGKAAITPRKILVVSQFTFSIALMISTVIIYQQIQHAKGRPLGYDPDNLISLGATSDLMKNYQVLKQELLNTDMIKAVSSASCPMTEIWNVWADFAWPGKDPNSNIVFSAIMTGYDYDKTSGLKLKEGRFFSSEFATDSTAVILNEAAVKTIGFKDPIGQTIKLAHMNLTVIGVIANIVMDDPFRPVLPSAILFNPTWIGDITLRLKRDADLRTALATIQPIVEKHNPAYPFEFHFVDEEFEKKFTSENQVGKLAGIFAGLAIFISCLGLFGLAAHMAESRTKEIGVRKVLGATATSLWALLSKELIVLVLISCLTASTIAAWFMNDWLEKYQYRIEIGWWVFVLAGGLALLIALLTVSYQSVKAALANPVDALRYE